MLLSLIVAGAFAVTAPPPREAPSAHRAAPPFCTLVPGSTLAILRVEKDTTLRFAPAGVQPMSASGVRASASDSLLATPETPMPAARVRLLQLDSATRAILASHGVSASQPVAFIRAAPYRADCRTMRWIDTVPFVVPGEVGFVRATLAPREQWIDGTPLLVIPDGWNYPYPRRRGLAYAAPSDAMLAPAAAMFSLTSLLEMPRPKDASALIASDSARRMRALAWAQANAAAAELEPARAIVRRAVLEADWRAAERAPSRLRGTYRVDLAIGDQRGTWYFRTHDRPGYSWRGRDSLQTTAALIASPYSPGYRLVGYAAATPDASFSIEARDMMRAMLVWLSTDDRPTAPGNDARRVLSGMLEFKLAAAPESFWNDLEAFVPRMSERDSLMLVRLNHPFERGQKQPQLPLTVRLDAGGGVRADTTFTVGGRTLRVVLQRIDTLTTRRPF
ncbi:MAG: hypothetical protein ACYC5V_07385 [Gemmatimonadaceae bacterium]